jgi:hypothetical protein
VPGATDGTYRLESLDGDVLPLLEDLDGDGVEDIIGLRWDASHEAAALSVIATSGKTFRDLWSIQPVPAQWYSSATHLVRSGESLFFADGEGSLRVIGLRDGKIRATVTTPRPGEICGATEGPARVFLRADQPGDYEQGVIVDAEGHVEPAKRPAWCAWSWKRLECPHQDGSPCVPSVTPPFLDKVAGYSSPIEEGDVGVATVSVKSTKKDAPPAGLQMLFGYDPKTKAKRWETPIPFSDDELHPSPSLSHTLRAGRFFAY